ncbi:sulfatase family protein [Paenibacillus cremeus]|nr:sulfatase-like hydrolase/transferase [Paenibacillus cremeus]
MKPNILWICTDQQRTDTLHCYGNSIVDTANIDRLAEMGVLFEQAYCQSPVCTPSRASFMTGRYSRTTRCRQNGQKIPDDEKLVSKLFAEQGYVCGLAGKLHLAPCHPDICKGVEERIDDGYHAFHWSHAVGGHAWALDDYLQWLEKKGATLKREPIPGVRQTFYGNDPENRQGTWCTDEAISFIRANRRHGNPWFFSVNYFDPHHPFDPPKELMEKYMALGEQIPLPNYIEGELDNKPRYQRIDSENAYNFNAMFRYREMSELEHRAARASQWAMVEHLDTQVGRLLDELEQSGELDNTIIIFMSDHGEMLGDHGIYWKGPYFYEELVRVPLMIAWPGKVAGGRRSKALVELVDLAPTLLEASSLPLYPGIQGRSLWSLLTGETELNKHRDSVYCEYYNAQPWHPELPPQCTMVFDGRYKLVRVHSAGEGELYDLLLDPKEHRNLYHYPYYGKEKLRLLELLTDRMAWTVDPLPERLAEW